MKKKYVSVGLDQDVYMKVEAFRQNERPDIPYKRSMSNAILYILALYFRSIEESKPSNASNGGVCKILAFSGSN